ncbi:MAG: hypothetical protein AAF202_05280, partial [Pseudomonadota bacterium]
DESAANKKLETEAIGLMKREFLEKLPAVFAGEDQLKYVPADIRTKIFDAFSLSKNNSCYTVIEDAPEEELEQRLQLARDAIGALGMSLEESLQQSEPLMKGFIRKLLGVIPPERIQDVYAHLPQGDPDQAKLEVFKALIRNFRWMGTKSGRLIESVRPYIIKMLESDYDLLHESEDYSYLLEDWEERGKTVIYRDTVLELIQLGLVPFSDQVVYLLDLEMRYLIDSRKGLPEHLFRVMLKIEEELAADTVDESFLAIVNNTLNSNDESFSADYKQELSEYTHDRMLKKPDFLEKVFEMEFNARRGLQERYFHILIDQEERVEPQPLSSTFFKLVRQTVASADASFSDEYKLELLSYILGKLRDRLYSTEDVGWMQKNLSSWKSMETHGNIHLIMASQLVYLEMKEITYAEGLVEELTAVQVEGEKADLDKAGRDLLRELGEVKSRLQTRCGEILDKQD